MMSFTSLALLLLTSLFVDATTLDVSIRSANSTTLATCAAIKSALPGRISYANDAAYNSSQTDYYITEEREMTPSCIFRPQSASDVSEFVKLAAAHNTLFAIRSGGHMLFSGAANIDGEGITVDMRGFDEVVVSEDKKMVSIGGGAVWSNVYPQLVPHNLTALGGRLPGIAIGGFTSGGGKNYLAREHGWSCDNVFGYEIVLASGEIVYATESEHHDLWIALKGGSSNFGIITRFDVAAFPLGLMWGGVIQYNYTDAVLELNAEAFSSFMLEENFDGLADVEMLLNFQNPGKVFSIIDSPWYSAEVSNPDVFANFTSIPSIYDTLALRNVADQVESWGELLPLQLERCFQLVYTFENPASSVYLDLMQIWESGMAALADVEGMTVQFLLQALPVTNGTNSLGLPSGKKDLVMGAITAGWNLGEDEELVRETIQGVFDQQVDVLRREGVFWEYQYLNYADISQDPIRNYGEANVEELRKTSKKYDSEGMFQTLVPGGFKLF